MSSPEMEIGKDSRHSRFVWPLPLDRQRVWIVRLIWAAVFVALALVLLNLRSIGMLPEGAGVLGLALLLLLFEIHARAKAAAVPGSTPRYLGIAVAVFVSLAFTAGFLATEHGRQREAVLKQSALLSLQFEQLDGPHRIAWLKSLPGGSICRLEPESRCAKLLRPYLDGARQALLEADEATRSQSPQTRP